MNGKELKVKELELKFGAHDRMVNVFGFFRYMPDNGLYVIYADVGTTYNYVCYGSAHNSGDSVLCMNPSKESDVEIIKEYIFKVTSDEELSDFEVISLDDFKNIEIIGSKNFEIKRDILFKLIEKTIPKKENAEEILEDSKKKKKSPLLTILFIFLLILGGFGYLYYNEYIKEDPTSTIIYCTKQYNHEELKSVLVEEEKTFKFDTNDKLSQLDVTMRYIFNDDSVYLDFINKSLYYKYMTRDTADTEGDYKLDDANKTFTTFAKTKIDESYEEPVEYEEVLSFNKTNNYTCEEKIAK